MCNMVNGRAIKTTNVEALARPDVWMERGMVWKRIFLEVGGEVGQPTSREESSTGLFSIAILAAYLQSDSQVLG